MTLTDTEDTTDRQIYRWGDLFGTEPNCSIQAVLLEVVEVDGKTQFRLTYRIIGIHRQRHYSVSTYGELERVVAILPINGPSVRATLLYNDNKELVGICVNEPDDYETVFFDA